jgi:alpha-L-fucosidase
MVRRYQPKAVINSRSGWQGDFASEEGSAPITGPIRARPWEKTFTLNPPAWGYAPTQNPLSFNEVITLVVNAAVRDGNVLVNVGPDPDGVIPPEQVKVLKSVGGWLRKNGESIYGTRGGPFQPVDNVYGATSSGRYIYLHIFSWPQSELKLPPIPQKVVRVKNLSGRHVDLKQDSAGLTVVVPSASRSAVDTIVRLTLAR